MTAPTRAETIAHGAAGNRRGEGCCSLPGHAKAGLVPDAVKPRIHELDLRAAIS